MLRLVLGALILVAAVANLNLAVANVALPDIGKAFDAGADRAQPRRRRLLARPRRLGPLPRRARRPLRAQADARARHGAVDPGLPARRPRAVASRCCSPPACSAASPAGMAYPTTLALITALWSGPRRTHAIALWSAIGGAISALGPLIVGRAARAASTGARCSSSRCRSRSSRCSMALRARPRARQRDDRPGRQPRRHPLGRCWSPRSCWRSTSRPCRTGRRSRSGWRRSRSRRSSRSCSASGGRRIPLYDLDVAAPADLLGRGLSPGSSCSAR